MKLPHIGQWVMVLWTDASRGDGWHEGDEERPRTIEVSTGMCQGKTVDKKLRVAPTVTMDVADGEVLGILDELEIPIGTIAAWLPVPKPEMPTQDG